MKGIAWFIQRVTIVIFMAVVVIVVAACGNSAADKNTGDTYKLTHSAADAEYILSWDTIVSKCPDIGKYEKQEDFLHRGESKESISGGTSFIEPDSPAAWASTRLVQTAPAGEKIRGFGVFISYYELDEYLDELLATEISGFPVQEDGEFKTGVVENGPPMQSVQILLAGKHFAILMMETASSDESLFFSKEKLLEFLPDIKSKISSLEITPLPSDIPERNPPKAIHEWQEFMTFYSDELLPPVQVPEGQHYNDLIFSDRPLTQVFSFTMDKDWRFVMTAEGEPDTRFEVYITVTSPGEEGLSYSIDHVFTLNSAPITITREEPLEEQYTPPVDIKINVFFDKLMDWVMKIEK
jgi:hypothetical protein